MPASELKPGDIIEVAPGSRLPADGQILTSSVSFDESALTGESVPVERQLGEKVMAGCMVVDKVVRLTIISAQGENAIDRILHLIEDAEARKAPLERFLDKFSRWYTPAMIGLAALVIVVPPLFLVGYGIHGSIRFNVTSYCLSLCIGYFNACRYYLGFSCCCSSWCAN